MAGHVKEIAVRRASFAFFPLAAMILTWAGFSVLFLTVHAEGAATGVGVGAGLMTIFWIFGWHDAIRYTEDYVSVTNLIFTTKASWTDVVEVAPTGELSVLLWNRERLGSIQFGGSLIGAFTKYPSHRNARETLRRAHSKAVSAEPAGGRHAFPEKSLSWQQPLLVAVLSYVSLLPAVILGPSGW
jgi:hypothetical protein